MLSVENIAKREDPYQLFFDYFKNNETKRKYSNFLQNFLVLIPPKIYESNGISPPSSKDRGELARKFVELAHKDRKAVQNVIAAYIKEDKKLVAENKLHPNTVPNHIKPIKTLLDSNDILLNWKNLNRLLPRAQKTDDRAYTREEIQRMLEASRDGTRYE
jgi:integrase